ncbi:MAG: hypothetical protein ACYC7D_00495 [Nitrososphaerales archaeon]
MSTQLLEQQYSLALSPIYPHRKTELPNATIVSMLEAVLVEMLKLPDRSLIFAVMFEKACIDTSHAELFPTAIETGLPPPINQAEPFQDIALWFLF